MKSDLSDRFWSKVVKGGPIPNHMPHLGPCWMWVGAICNGRGRILVNGKNKIAARISYQVNFKDPGALWVLHKCDNGMCVRPDHLFLGTAADNSRDMTLKKRHALHKLTHCKYGHPFSGENLSIVKLGTITYRKCKICHRRRVAEHKQRLNGKNK